MANEFKFTAEARSTQRLRREHQILSASLRETFFASINVTSFARPRINSPFAIEICPLARLNETRPVEGMAALWIRPQFQLSLSERLAAFFPSLQSPVILIHQFPRAFVAYCPEANNLSFTPR